MVDAYSSFHTFKRGELALLDRDRWNAESQNRVMEKIRQLKIQLKGG